MTTRIIVVLAALAVLAGCETTPTQQDFGNSVGSLIKAQTANPATLTSPSSEAVTGIDPDYVRNALIEMRKSVSKPSEVYDPIEMLLMGAQGGQ